MGRKTKAGSLRRPPARRNLRDKKLQRAAKSEQNHSATHAVIQGDQRPSGDSFPNHDFNLRRGIGSRGNLSSPAAKRGALRVRPETAAWSCFLLLALNNGNHPVTRELRYRQDKRLVQVRPVFGVRESSSDRPMGKDRVVARSPREPKQESPRPCASKTEAERISFPGPDNRSGVRPGPGSPVFP